MRMLLAYRIITSILLLINGMGAIYGGLSLMMFPDGSHIQLSMDWLEDTPFHDYLIPGMILFMANGFLSIFVFTAVLLNHRYYSWLVITQGVVLCGWIGIQILMLQTIYFLHIIMGGIGIALIVLGWIQKNN